MKFEFEIKEEELEQLLREALNEVVKKEVASTVYRWGVEYDIREKVRSLWPAILTEKIEAEFKNVDMLEEKIRAGIERKLAAQLNVVMKKNAVQKVQS